MINIPRGSVNNFSSLLKRTWMCSLVHNKHCNRFYMELTFNVALLLLIIIWLAPWAGKMYQITRCDWLPGGQDGAILIARETTHRVPGEKFPPKPYNESLVSVKMSGYWPRSFFTSLWTSTPSQRINTQKNNNVANIQPSWSWISQWNLCYSQSKV